MLKDQHSILSRVFIIMLFHVINVTNWNSSMYVEIVLMIDHLIIIIIRSLI